MKGFESSLRHKDDEGKSSPKRGGVYCTVTVVVKSLAAWRSWREVESDPHRAFRRRLFSRRRL
jgi:hypothetical protein